MSEKIAVITGGAGDLGQALASAFAERGHQVIAPGRSELDVTSQKSVERFFEKNPIIDILVNNAGITDDGLFARQSPENWTRVIDTSLSGTFRCSRAAIGGMMKRRRGHLIQIGSFSSIHPPVGQTAYASAKAGLVGWSKSLAKELGPRNIKVNVVLPGFLETNMTSSLSPAAKSAALARHALGRFTTAEESARWIAHLADCDFISGQVFQLDSRVSTDGFT
ncbi:MAG: SDR family NAD(P)-dependent oxidoreductase [Verrucomicrobiota bacterium]